MSNTPTKSRPKKYGSRQLGKTYQTITLTLSSERKARQKIINAKNLQIKHMRKQTKTSRMIMAALRATIRPTIRIITNVLLFPIPTIHSAWVGETLFGILAMRMWQRAERQQDIPIQYHQTAELRLDLKITQSKYGKESLSLSRSFPTVFDDVWRHIFVSTSITCSTCI